jgi:hypothetical protein
MTGREQSPILPREQLDDSVGITSGPGRVEASKLIVDGRGAGHGTDALLRERVSRVCSNVYLPFQLCLRGLSSTSNVWSTAAVGGRVVGAGVVDGQRVVDGRVVGRRVVDGRVVDAAETIACAGTVQTLMCAAEQGKEMSLNTQNT